MLDVPTTVGGGPPGVGSGNGKGAAPETGLACGLAAAAGEALATGETAGLAAGDVDVLCGAGEVAAPPCAPLVGLVFATFGAHAVNVRPRPT